MTMPRTTSGRFWAYVGTMIGLGASLAGNVAAASLHNAKPNEIDYSLAAVAPAAVFLAIEIGSRNPWEHTPWGPTLRRAMMWIVGPAAAVFSFIHLVELSLDGKETIVFSPGHFHVLALVNWIAAILVPLMIDGLMVGSAAALLLPPQRVTVIEHGFRGHALSASASKNDVAALRTDLERAWSALAATQADLKQIRQRKRPATAAQVVDAPSAPPVAAHPDAKTEWNRHFDEHGKEPSIEDVTRWLAADGRRLEPNAVRAQMSRWRTWRAGQDRRTVSTST